MAKDELFKNSEQNGIFQFNERVAEVFDDMLLRSVPGYSQVVSMTGQILNRYLKDKDRVYDLGCSTGATLIELARHLDGLELLFVGIDNSTAMIEKARRKADMYGKQDKITFIEEDIMEADLEGAGAVILNYTLQFVEPALRQDFLRKIHSSIRPGGVLVVSEKVILQDLELNNCFVDFYYDFKRGQGYSEIEIARKKEALEDVLKPFTIERNRELLHMAGFTRVETFSQWFNFVSYMAVK